MADESKDPREELGEIMGEPARVGQRPVKSSRTVFGGNTSMTVVTHLGTIHSGNLMPDRHSWLVTRYYRAGLAGAGVACQLSQIQLDDTQVWNPAQFAGPGELEDPNA